MKVYKIFFKPLFFLLSPEQAHHLVLTLLEFLMKFPGGEWLLRKIFSVHHSSLQKEVMGLTFLNPVGLAAGFDKDGKHIRVLSALGFGFIELGTVTPLPQPGNDRPRLFRLPKDAALINRMGFNNEGVDVMASRLKTRERKNIMIGGNIGKNKNTPLVKAIDDYAYCFEKLFDHVDYFVVNVSSPNTPGLRSLQEKEPLLKLLSHLQQLNRQHALQKPVLLKISPDLDRSQLDEIIEIILLTGLDGIIAANTTIRREPLETPVTQIEKCGAGGLSGLPLKAQSTEMIKYIHSKARGKFIIIGVGGIHSPADAMEKLSAGASLVQVYTGLIYEGPGLIKKINESILKTEKRKP